MKLIHTADLHLDSKLNSHLDPQHAKERKGEILSNFSRLVETAVSQNVSAILIAGDLFDRPSISAGARNVVLGEIRKYPDLQFYYLKGNHDRDNFLSELEEIPENLHLFESSWTCYTLGHVDIYGVELTRENVGHIFEELLPDASRINICMLHGQMTESGSKDKAETINLRALKNKGIDYLALGHIHSYRKEALDSRGVWSYSGCLEGRGFDECGECGYVLIDVNEETKTVSSSFVPFAKRQLYEIKVDVTACHDTADIENRINDELSNLNIAESSLVRIVLVGNQDVNDEKDTAFLEGLLNGRFYFGQVKDETKLQVNFMDYRYDKSLKGAFVRRVLAEDSLNDEEKASVIRFGLRALAGEEVLS